MHGLKHDIIIVPHSSIPVILHEFHNSKGHQGTIHKFEAIKRFFWWPKVCQDIMKILTCVTSVLKCTIYGQSPIKAFRNTTGPSGRTGYGYHRSSTSYIQRMPKGFNSNMYAHVICICYTNETKVSRNIVQHYLSGVFAHKGDCIAIESDNGTEIKNTFLDDTCEQLRNKEIVFKLITKATW